MQIKESLPRTLAVPVAMFVVAALGSIVLSSLTLTPLTKTSPLPYPTEMASPHEHPVDRELKLMPQKEILRYNVDPKKAVRLGAKPPENWWEDISYGQSGLCGGAKCFFLSEADPSRGYLVGLPVVRGLPVFDAAARANEYALTLESEYGVRHFFAGPPFELATPRHFSDHLRGDYVPFYEGAESLIVQPSRTAPEGSVIVRCYDDRVLYGRLAYILQYMNKYSRQRLGGRLRGAIHLVQEHPELRTDFQLMIDKKGELYHLDLDRVENPTSAKDARHFEGCLEGAVEYVGAYKSEHEASENEAVETEAVAIEAGENEAVVSEETENEEVVNEAIVVN